MAVRATRVIIAYMALLVLSVLLTYGLAVGFGHVDAFVPFLGFLGDHPPESTFFTQLFVFTSSALAFVVQVNYVCISASLEKHEASRHVVLLNVASVYAGHLSALGLFVLACFQESHAYVVHHAAELLYLAASILYFGLLTFISKRQKDFRTGVRVALNGLMLAFFAFYLVSYVVAVRKYHGPWDQRHHWGRHDGGWIMYLLSSTSEWILLFLFQSYIFTFFVDLQYVLLTKTAIVILKRRTWDGMELRGDHLILLVSILFPTTMTITFTLAVVFEHVYPIMPFISYTGDLPVESCIFSLGLNLVAVLYIIIMYLRYNQVIKFCEEEDPAHLNTILRLNQRSLPWGVASSVGLSVTGSFQELHVACVHRLGALVCTYSGFIYMWFQTVVSDLVAGKLNTKRVSFLRTGLSMASTAIHVVAPAMVAFLDLTYPRCHEETLLWSIEEAGWHLHICCSFMEWAIFFINVTYVASFYSEFKFIQIKKDEVTFVREWRPEGESPRAESSGQKKVK